MNISGRGIYSGQPPPPPLVISSILQYGSAIDINKNSLIQGLGARAACFWPLGDGAGIEKTKNQEPAPPPKKTMSLSRSHQNYAASQPAPLEDKNHKKVAHFFLVKYAVFIVLNKLSYFLLFLVVLH